jgi:hypothetical protein
MLTPLRLQHSPATPTTPFCKLFCEFSITTYCATRVLLSVDSRMVLPSPLSSPPLRSVPGASLTSLMSAIVITHHSCVGVSSWAMVLLVFKIPYIVVLRGFPPHNCHGFLPSSFLFVFFGRWRVMGDRDLFLGSPLSLWGASPALGKIHEICQRRHRSVTPSRPSFSSVSPLPSGKLHIDLGRLGNFDKCKSGESELKWPSDGHLAM